LADLRFHVKNATGELYALLHQLQTEVPIGVHQLRVKPAAIILNDQSHVRTVS
jgi:hypothetical protein